MPEFETRKRKTMSEQELYREYHGEEKASGKASAAKSTNNSGKKRNSSKKEASSVGSEGKRTREELRQKQTTAKRYKTYAGRTTGKALKSSTKPSGNTSSSFSGSSSHSRSGSPSRSNSPSRSGSSSKRRSQSRSVQNEKRKKRAGKYTLYYVLIGVLAVIALTVLSTTVLFNIGVFVVSGESVYSDEEIIEACGIKKGENLLKINTSRAESKVVSKLVYIDSVEIHRGFPNRLTLSVTPAKPTVAFAFGGKYYVISERKRLLEISDTPLDCPVIKGVQMLLQPEEKKKETTAADGGSVNSSSLTSEEGITLENGAEEISVGAVLGDDNNNRIKLALSIAKLMRENGLTKDYEVNIADTLDVTISYDGHIKIELGTTAALNDKIYRASRIIEEDIGENENCTLNITNPNRAVKRPIYESSEGGSVTMAPEVTTEEETPPPEE